MTAGPTLPETPALTFGGEPALETVDLGGRRAQPLDPPAIRLDDIVFSIAVSPSRRTYLTLELSGDDVSDLKTLVFVDGLQASYRDFGDYEPINAGTRGGLPGRHFFTTALLPVTTTAGATSVEITLRTYRALYRPHADEAGFERAEEPSRRFFRAFSHTSPALDVAPADDAWSAAFAPTGRLDTDAERDVVIGLRRRQEDRFRALAARYDAGDDAFGISRYDDDLRFFAAALHLPWCPARSDAERGDALNTVLGTVDHYTRAYYRDVLTLVSGGHQSDWGGYYAALGEALYVVEPLIDDPAILGRPAFEAFLDEPFETGTEDGPTSLGPGGPEGAPLTRRAAWERVLKANFDFARSRLSYIYNQVSYTYEGAWKAHEGLRVIGSARFEGVERSHAILREALGIAPFLGEEVLVGPAGDELDLTHSLFHHDTNIVLTDDIVQIVVKGLARSAVDDSGDVLRRRPYGDVYRGLTVTGLARENGYVGAYGELAHSFTTWFFRTLDRREDEALNDDILRYALLNLHARGRMRYAGHDPQGRRAMLMEQVIDDRNSDYPGRVAYGPDAQNGAALRYASLDEHMQSHAERYEGPQWDDTRQFAGEATSWARQMLFDDQFMSAFERGADVTLANDLRVVESYDWVVGQAGDGSLLPHTRPERYDEDELADLGLTLAPRDSAFAVVDPDALVVSLRDGETHVFASLTERNIGFTGVGRAHLLHGSTEQLTAISTFGVLRAREYTLRGETRESWRQSAPDRVVEDRPFALLGELIPVAFQPGVGVIERDNNLYDTPFSALPELAVSRVGRYLIVVNTTRAEHGNSRPYTIAVPGTATAVRDLVSGCDLEPSDDRWITVSPLAAVVLDVGDAPDEPVAVRAGDSAVRPGIAPADGIAPSWCLIDSDGLLATLTETPDDTWSVAEIGAAFAGDTRRSGSEVASDTARATGFGGGDDARLTTRWQPDSLVLTSIGVAGSVDVTVRIDTAGGPFTGIALREGLGPVARLVAIGATSSGDVEIRTRTLDTREDIGIGNPGDDAAGGTVRSPTCFRAPLGDSRWLRLTRDARTHRVTASTRIDDGSWSVAWSGLVPMLPVVRAGSVVTGPARLSDLAVDGR